MLDYSGGNHNNGTFWGSKQSERYDALKKTSEVDESCRAPVQEPEKHRRFSSDSFLRVLFWQFHNFRMLWGSDLLLFSNEKYAAVSVHLWDVGRQVTPLMWLEAWLDNVMASVPELAICYHRHGVVQGYELLKTEDVFLLKGISEDVMVAFHPQVVQQNGLSVLQFLQDNCKQDPGSYWLFKSAGEDIIQLFDLSVLPKTRASENDDKDCHLLPIFMNRSREYSLFSLGTLLYRLGHKLSLSKVHNNRTKCAKLFKKCLEFLNGRDHLVIRAYAHEQFARLILASYKELDLTMEPLLECGATVVDMQGETCELSSVASKFVIEDDELQSCSLNNLPSTEELGVLHLSTLDAPQKINSLANFHGMLESALSHLLEARHIAVSVGEPNHANTKIDPSVYQKFFTQLQSLLKKMLSIAVAGSSSKLSDPGDGSHKAGDVKKLEEMYRLSLKATRIEQLNDIYELWTS